LNLFHKIVQKYSVLIMEIFPFFKYILQPRTLLLVNIDYFQTVFL
jgi:hypothetical protein